MFDGSVSPQAARIRAACQEGSTVTGSSRPRRRQKANSFAQPTSMKVTPERSMSVPCPCRWAAPKTPRRASLLLRSNSPWRAIRPRPARWCLSGCRASRSRPSPPFDFRPARAEVRLSCRCPCAGAGCSVPLSCCPRWSGASLRTVFPCEDDEQGVSLPCAYGRGAGRQDPGPKYPCRSRPAGTARTGGGGNNRRGTPRKDGTPRASSCPSF
jgi:hypothetical protein